MVKAELAKHLSISVAVCLSLSLCVCVCVWLGLKYPENGDYAHNINNHIFWPMRFLVNHILGIIHWLPAVSNESSEAYSYKAVFSNFIQNMWNGMNVIWAQRTRMAWERRFVGAHQHVSYSDHLEYRFRRNWRKLYFFLWQTVSCTAFVARNKPSFDFITFFFKSEEAWFSTGILVTPLVWTFQLSQSDIIPYM